MSDLYTTGVRQIIDDHLIAESKKVRDYGDYWSASSAGYCHKKLILERLGVPSTQPDDARKQRVFTAGHIFHDWVQELTRNAGVSVAQEVELVDDTLMVKGHFDDLILAPLVDKPLNKTDYHPAKDKWTLPDPQQHLILYDYKTANSRAFDYKKIMSHYHKMQLATYLYMLRKKGLISYGDATVMKVGDLSEARILILEKDTLRTLEFQLIWTPDLEKEIVGYWTTLNGYWKKKMLPKCTCADYEGGFMSSEKFNPFYYNGQSCSTEWYELCRKEGKLTK